MTRRDFAAASAAAFTILRPEVLRGQVKDKLRAGLVGCGGRGSQAVIDLLTGNPNVELVSMGDVFDFKLEQSPSPRMRAGQAVRRRWRTAG